MRRRASHRTDQMYAQGFILSVSCQETNKGPQAWEFKHRDFRVDSKDSLENIRRKAPAPRKQAQANEESTPTQQIDLLSQQVVAQQQQIEHLSGRYAQLTVDHQLMLQEILRVQKTVINHENVIHQVMSYLLSLDARQRRNSVKSSVSFQPPAQAASGVNDAVTASEDVPSPTPLQTATKLLSDMNSELQPVANNVDALGDPQKATAAAANAAAANMVPALSLENSSRNGAVQPATTAVSNPSLVYPKMNSELEQVVYPVGTTNGIDPSMYNENISTVPYPIPQQPKELEPTDQLRRQFPENRKRSTNIDPGWMRSPHILLVEDDATCRQIGGKFLFSFSCVIDAAVRECSLFYTFLTRC